jgi:hypothetical protein
MSDVDSQSGGCRATGIEAAVCQDIAWRQRMGVQKYGVSVADNPLHLREWLEHAYEECLDQAIYLKRAIVEIDRGTVLGISKMEGIGS